MPAAGTAVLAVGPLRVVMSTTARVTLEHESSRQEAATKKLVTFIGGKSRYGRLVQGKEG